MKIIVDDLSGPEIAALIDDHVRDMRAVTPLESKHSLDLDGLRRPEITFWSAYDGGTLVGCGAIKHLSDSHAEVKAMRTQPSRKRNGVASRLLAHIIIEARRMGYSRLSLETGTDEYFVAARRLYEKCGFEYTVPFGDYTDDPHSTYMTLVL